MNLARLNHILIPSTKEGRDRVRAGWAVRIFRPLTWFGEATTREGRFLTLLVMAIALASVDVQSTQVFLLWAALSGILLASLVGRHFFRLQQVKLRAQCPHRVTEGEALEIRLSVENNSDEPHQALRITGPFLPWDGAWVSPAPRIAELEAGATAERTTHARFIERGEHHLDVFSAACLVPFGLALGPSVESDGCRFTVLPRPIQVRSLALSQATLDAGAKLGAKASRGRGAGLELLGVRGYRAGDPVRDLHVRTWARTGKPHVREYQPTYEGRYLLLLDAAGARDEPAFEASIRLTAGICTLWTDQGQICDLAVSGEAAVVHGIGSYRESLTAALDRLARVAPNSLPIEEVLERIAALTSDEVEAIVVVTSSAERQRRISAMLRGLGHPSRTLCLVKRRVDPDPDQLLVSEVMDGREVAL
ncbi:MAG: DUF58 domain-containing protein [Polyangiaceae bacterium]|nr:DUF58 domain-containing protein [Myxococcales bacterium]MCB9586883.1 DUF58 domain-containing protein [Polyangiaceae bacterium]MCB9608171.1 DUF58 domain-containing protein [Polyangiaceae bacterium]